MLGIALLSLVFGGILILDVPGLLRDLKTMFRNIGSGLGFKVPADNYKKKKSVEKAAELKETSTQLSQK